MARAPLGILVLLLAGCAGESFDGFPDRALNTETRENQLKPALSDGRIKAYNDADGLEKRRIRNEVVNAHVALIDIAFTEYLKDLHQVGVGLNLGTDAATIGLGAAGALISGGTSQVLSGTSAAITGFKESVDKEAFFEQTMPALVTKMLAERQKVLVTIRTGLSRSVEEYPLTQGLGDIESYYYAGTIPGALAGVANDAGADVQRAKDDLRDIVTVFSEDEATDILRAFWKPEGTDVDQANAARLNDWLTRNFEPGQAPRIPTFLSGDYGPQRRQAVSELNLN